jgi:hypothetical protein
MLLKDIFEDWEDRHEYQLQHHQPSEPQEQMYALVNKAGQVVRSQLSVRAAKAMQIRPDLVKKNGPLFLRKI